MPGIPVPRTLGDVACATEAVLTDFFTEREHHTHDIAPDIGTATASLRDFVMQGGKRVRPTFAWAGWKVADGASSNDIAVMTAVSSLELIQACALIHDDIIDRSDTRRGRPTVHRRAEALHRQEGWHGPADHFGQSVGILLGDLALAWADDMTSDALGTLAPAPSVGAQVRRIWTAMRTEVLCGQYLDLLNEASGNETHESAYRVMRYKTAAYTIERPLQFGAALAGADESIMETLGRAGTDLGIAFQLRDDLLGVFGDPALTGKPSGDDIITGKRTTLLADGLALATERNPLYATTIRDAIGREISSAELDQVRTILVDVGAVDRAESTIDQLLTSGLAAIDRCPGNAAAKSELSEMAQRITTRTA